jgi:hypothetical protein
MANSTDPSAAVFVIVAIKPQETAKIVQNDKMAGITRNKLAAIRLGCNSL